MRYFNNDGSEASTCINGARCVVSYAYRLGLVKDKGKFMSTSGPVGFYYKNGSVSIEIMPPVDLKLNFSFTLKRKKYNACFLKVGVPHCVIFVDSYDKIDVKELGRSIRNHKTFKPEGANVNFVMAKNNVLFVRTYERGIEDETLSCGSGVLASAYIAAKLFITQSPVVCKTNGGELVVTIKDKLYIEGPANVVYDGVYYLH
jgi:diaminopimelate epimerase